MDRMTKGMAYKSGAFIVVLLVLIIIMWSNLNSMITERCKNRVIRETRSPGSIFKAVIFERDCGTTAGISTQASLLPVADQLPNRKGNLIIVEGLANPSDVQITWKGTKNLYISTRKNLKIQKAKSEVLGVQILYRIADDLRQASKKNNNPNPSRN
jgi:hypothetical protein